MPPAVADRVAHAITSSGGGDAGRFASEAGGRFGDIFRAVQLDFAHSVQTVFYLMAGVMALAFVVAVLGVPHGRVEEEPVVVDEEVEVGPVADSPA